MWAPCTALPKTSSTMAGPTVAVLCSTDVSAHHTASNANNGKTMFTVKSGSRLPQMTAMVSHAFATLDFHGSALADARVSAEMPIPM